MTENRVFKVAGGKLLKASFELDQGVLRHVKITGDFFMYPEEKIGTLQQALNGVPCNKTNIRDAVQRCFDGNEIEFVGGTPDDFAELFTQEAPAQ